MNKNPHYRQKLRMRFLLLLVLTYYTLLFLIIFYNKLFKPRDYFVIKIFLVFIVILNNIDTFLKM